MLITFSWGYGHDSMTGGKIVENFLLKNLFLSKCQSRFVMGIIPLPHFPTLYPYTLPHNFPPLMVLTLY